MIPREDMRRMLIDLVHTNQVVVRRHTTQKLVDQAIAVSVQEDLIEVGFALSLINGLGVMGPGAVEQAIVALANVALDLDPESYLERILKGN